MISPIGINHNLFFQEPGKATTNIIKRAISIIPSHGAPIVTPAVLTTAK